MTLPRPLRTNKCALQKRSSTEPPPHCVVFVFSDDHAGLKKAIREVLTDAARQRCLSAEMTTEASPTERVVRATKGSWAGDSPENTPTQRFKLTIIARFRATPYDETSERLSRSPSTGNLMLQPCLSTTLPR